MCNTHCLLVEVRVCTRAEIVCAQSCAKVRAEFWERVHGVHAKVARCARESGATKRPRRQCARAAHAHPGHPLPKGVREPFPAYRRETAVSSLSAGNGPFPAYRLETAVPA